VVHDIVVWTSINTTIPKTVRWEVVLHVMLAADSVLASRHLLAVIAVQLSTLGMASTLSAAAVEETSTRSGTDVAPSSAAGLPVVGVFSIELDSVGSELSGIRVRSERRLLSAIGTGNCTYKQK